MNSCINDDFHDPVSDTDDYARVALPAGDAMEQSESNGETSDADSVAESDDHHGDVISVGSAEII